MDQQHGHRRKRSPGQVIRLTGERNGSHFHQVTFRGLAHPNALEEGIRKRVGWLEQFYSGIIRCRALVEVAQRHRHDGRHFHVRIEMTVPGGSPIVVSHEPSLHGPLKDAEESAHRKENEIKDAHRYARVAVHQAFDAARRRLHDFAREQRGAVKTPEGLRTW